MDHFAKIKLSHLLICICVQITVSQKIKNVLFKYSPIYSPPPPFFFFLLSLVRKNTQNTTVKQNAPLQRSTSDAKDINTELPECDVPWCYTDPFSVVLRDVS